MSNDPNNPNSAKSFDLQKARRLINSAAGMGRLPGADFIGQIAEQLSLAIEELNGIFAKVDRAQSDQIRCQRELETANLECRQLRADLLAIKSRPDPTITLSPGASIGNVGNEPASINASALEAKPAKKKPGPKAKVVPIIQQEKAQ